MVLIRALNDAIHCTRLHETWISGFRFADACTREMFIPSLPGRFYDATACHRFSCYPLHDLSTFHLDSTSTSLKSCMTVNLTVHLGARNR